MAEKSGTNLRHGFATRAIHEGWDPADGEGALVPPVHMTSTFAFSSVEDGMAIFAREKPGYRYARSGSPTISLLEGRIASLEGAEAAVAFASGMGAITAFTWAVCQAGDRVLIDQTLYGSTFAFFNEGLGKFGVEVVHVEMSDPANVAAAMTPNTKLVYFETPANPNMRLIDIAAVAEIVHQAAPDCLVAVDNTYCTPYLQRPLDLGADAALHSVTKYLGGHGDLMAGAVAGSQELMDKVRFNGLSKFTGAVLSGLNAHLVMRGLKTLELRMDRHCSSALHLARIIAEHPAVERIYYPGLESSPYHALAKRQMSAFGGMIAFELKGGFDAGVRFMDAVELVSLAVSLGDAETLVQHPASMTHRTYSPEQRAKYGIAEGLVRLSIGLETLDDLVADITQALDAAAR